MRLSGPALREMELCLPSGAFLFEKTGPFARDGRCSFTVVWKRGHGSPQQAPCRDGLYLKAQNFYACLRDHARAMRLAGKTVVIVNAGRS